MSGRLVDKLINFGLATAITIWSSPVNTTTILRQVNHPCLSDYRLFDPSVGILRRGANLLIGVGFQGQGFFLTGSLTRFNNGQVDLVYNTNDGKWASGVDNSDVIAARFTGNDGTVNVKSIGVDQITSRKMCYPTKR
jgi:hypothetical protein